MPRGVYIRTKPYSLEYIEQQRLSHLGKRLSAQTKAKIKASLLIYYSDPENRAKISQAMKGKRTRPLGYHHSERTKIKIGISNRKPKPSCSAFLTGRKLPTSHKHNLSLAHSTPEYKERYSGENSWSWRGGISRLPYSFDFNQELKLRIKERDNYTCQLCQAREVNPFYSYFYHHIHHIDYNKSNSDGINLIELCSSCNAKVNHNRDYWQVYLTTYQNSRDFSRLPKTGQQLLNNKYKSVARRVNECQNSMPPL